MALPRLKYEFKYTLNTEQNCLSNFVVAENVHISRFRADKEKQALPRNQEICKKEQVLRLVSATCKRRLWKLHLFKFLHATILHTTEAFCRCENWLGSDFFNQ